MNINAAFTILAALRNTILLLDFVGCSYFQRKAGNDSGEKLNFPIKV